MMLKLIKLEENRIKYKLEVEEALGNVGARMHDENLEGDIELCWKIMRQMNKNGEIDLQTYQRSLKK